MRRVAVRRVNHPPPQQFDENPTNKRWSTSLIENTEREEQTSLLAQSPYSTLLTNQLGIPREKAERACVATGFRSAQAATDWLLQRQNSDKLIRTEFLLLLCPDETLNEQIRKFNGEAFRSLIQDSPFKDRQHLRALKLSSFFHVPDQYVYTLHQTFDSVIEQYHRSSKIPLRLTLHTTSDYLMLIPDAESRKVIVDFFQMLKSQFEQLVPHVALTPAKKLAHLTLAHGLTSLFGLSVDQRGSLIQLARLCIDLDRPVRWHLRLFSREQSSMSEIVYRVISSPSRTTSESNHHNGLSLKGNDLFLVLDNGRVDSEEDNVYDSRRRRRDGSPARESTTTTSVSPPCVKPARRFHQRALIWDLEETRALLDLLKDERIFKAIESVRTREIYHEIAERLKQSGFNRDWNQIRGRVKNLKFSYKKARALHEEQGQSTLACRFYDDLHYLFGHKYKRQRSKKRPLHSKLSSSTTNKFNQENEDGEVLSNMITNDADELTDDDDEDEESMNEYLDNVSPDYVQRPEDPYPTLQSHSPDSLEHESDETPPVLINDELDVYLKSMSSSKHHSYLLDDVLQSVFQKFLRAQEQAEQRFVTFLTEQKRDEQAREERIHREQRQHQLELVQLILNQGRAHSTGEEGHFPLKNLRKTSETDTWTLQKSASVFHENVPSNASDISEPTPINELRNLTKKSQSSSRLAHTNGRSDPLSSTSNPGLIRLFCLRHGERVDFAFGPSWPESSFDKLGNYHRINLNMPVSLPRRRNPLRDFLGDSPITEIGASQARLTGEALAANDCLAQYCYSSPALRCIQTAHYLLQGMGIDDRVKIRIEPGLFEFLGWYERGLPSFFNPSEPATTTTTTTTGNNDDEQMQLFFNIDKNYRPIISVEKLSRDEKYLDYYNRSFKVTQQITDKHKLTGANIFFIGHAATLEVCTRQLCSLSPRSYSEFNGAIRKVSYLGLQLCERNPSDGQWLLKAPPIPPLQHANNLSYDWQTMK